MFLKKFFSDILGNITTSPVHLTSDKWLKYFLIKKQYKNLIIRINTGLITLYQGQNHSIYY